MTIADKLAHALRALRSAVARTEDDPDIDAAKGPADAALEAYDRALPSHGAITNAKLYLRSYEGKLIPVAAMFPVLDSCHASAAEPANAYMAENPGIGLLAIVNGMALLADNADLGRSPEDLTAAAPRMLALLKELVDIEGPCPGNAEWAQKVKSELARHGVAS